MNDKRAYEKPVGGVQSTPVPTPVKCPHCNEDFYLDVQLGIKILGYNLTPVFKINKSPIDDFR